jgi:hypothetical protein
LPESDDLQAFVALKLAKVFGEERARALLGEVLGELRLAAVESVDDLERVAGVLQRRGGFEATTGAMLAVRATMLRLRDR